MSNDEQMKSKYPTEVSNKQVEQTEHETIRATGRPTERSKERFRRIEPGNEVEEETEQGEQRVIRVA